MAAINGKHAGMQALSETEMMEIAMETRRRRDAISTGGANTLDDGGSCHAQFIETSQTFVMINMANAGLRPRSTQPAFRILGFFESPADLTSRVSLVATADASTCDIRMITAREFYGIPIDGNSLVADQQAKVNRNLVFHHQQLQADVTEFVDHKAQLTKGRVPVDMKADTIEDAVCRRNKNVKLTSEDTSTILDENASIIPALLQNTPVHATTMDESIQRLVETTPDDGFTILDENVSIIPALHVATLSALSNNDTSGDDDDGGVSESKSGENVHNVLPMGVMIGLEAANFDHIRDTSDLGSRVPIFPEMAEMRGQKFACLALLKDYETGVEPAVNIIRGFVTQEEAVSFNKYVASKYIDEHDLYVVEMYVWIYPHLVFSKDFDRVEQVYRNKEQDSIMRNQRTSSTKVGDFTRYFESRGLEVPKIEVDADLVPCVNEN